MKSENREKIIGQVKSSTPDAIIDVIVQQLDRNIEAKKRIDEEGVVVRDLKGSVVPHPAIKIEIDSGKIIAEMVSKYKAPQSAQ